MSSTKPEWADIIVEGDQWQFHGGKLLEEGVDTEIRQFPNKESALHRFIMNRYHVNKILPNAQAALDRTLAELDRPGAWGANVGAGHTTMHPRLINLEVEAKETVDIVTKGGDFPFKDGSLDVCVSQEVIEHAYDPFTLVENVWAALKPGGKFYCQAPFMIGYHPGPTDFWRFSREAYSFLFKEDRWRIHELDISLGHGSGLYRILVEFWAVNASLISPKLYMPTKGFFALLLSFLPLLDRFTGRSNQKDRIPGGYYIVAEKI